MIAPEGLVDFHCHLDLYPDHRAAVQEAEEAGVFTLAVTTTPRAWPRNHELAQATRHVRAALGLHPQLVGERASELALWDTHFAEARYIGEVGLDAGPRFYKSFDLQKQIFEHILRRCADGPFTQTGERPSKPSDVLNVVETLGRLHGLSTIEVAEKIKANLRELLEFT